jgi:hypothetical protein
VSADFSIGDAAAMADEHGFAGSFADLRTVVC